MSAATVVLILLLLAVMGTLPTWSYSREWGYAPSGLLAAALVTVLVLFLAGRL